MSQLVPIHARHVDVGDQDRNLVVMLEMIESVGSIGRTDHIAAEVVQHVCEDVEDSGIVVYYKDRAGHHRTSFLSCSTQPSTSRSGPNLHHPKLLDGQLYELRSLPDPALAKLDDLPS